jgi:hypothetical protein
MPSIYYATMTCNPKTKRLQLHPPVFGWPYDVQANVQGIHPYFCAASPFRGLQCFGPRSAVSLRPVSILYILWYLSSLGIRMYVLAFFWLSLGYTLAPDLV